MQEQQAKEGTAAAYLSEREIHVKHLRAAACMQNLTYAGYHAQLDHPGKQAAMQAATKVFAVDRQIDRQTGQSQPMSKIAPMCQGTDLDQKKTNHVYDVN